MKIIERGTKKMRKIMLIAATVLLGVFFAAQSAKAVDLSMLPSDLQDLITNLLDTRFPPELKSVKLEPAEPVAGSPTKVTAEIYNDSAVTSDTTTGVALYYMVNFDGVWIPVEMSSDDSKVWTGELPAFAKDDEIIYSLRATDSSTNVLTTVPCKVGEMEGDAIAGPAHLKDCVKSGDLTTCESDTKPRMCLSKGSADEDPLNDEDSKMPADSDFMDVRVGYDDTYYYYDLSVEGKIYQGTANPLDIRAYVGLVINPDKVGKVRDLDAILSSSGAAALVYAPLADLAGGVAKSCSMTYMKGNGAEQDGNAVVCKASANHLIFKIKRKNAEQIIGKNPSGVLDFLAVTATITNLSPVNGTKYDFTHFTSAQFTDEPYFQVK